MHYNLFNYLNVKYYMIIIWITILEKSSRLEFVGDVKSKMGIPKNKGTRENDKSHKIINSKNIYIYLQTLSPFNYLLVPSLGIFFFII